MDKLRVSLKGPGLSLELKNPVLTASGTFGYGLEFMPYGDLQSLGGIVVKGLSLAPREGNPMPRIAETPCGMLNSIGLQNCGVEAFIRHKLPLLPTDSLPVIANLYATSSAEFSELAAILAAESGIAALEVNISCPNVAEGGSSFGQDPRMAAAVTEAVKKSAGSKPVIVKLSPNVTDICEIARACESAGADWVKTSTGYGFVKQPDGSYKVKVRREKMIADHAVIENVPVSEYRWLPDSSEVEGLQFCYHRRLMSRSEIESLVNAGVFEPVTDEELSSSIYNYS